MDYQKLLLAAQVNDLAKGLRASARNRAFKETEGMIQGAREDAMQAWDDENNLNSYIQPAFAQLMDVSKEVDSLWREADEAERRRQSEAMVRAFTS